MKEILKRIVEHDLYYRMSDDDRIYSKGLETEKKLREEIAQFDLQNILDYFDSLKRELTLLHNQNPNL